MTSQALGGKICPVIGIASEGSPSLLEVRHTHTHTQKMGAMFFFVRGCSFVYLYLGKLFLSAHRRIHIKK
jgi:hypothetical protein